jgi:hypothetical protein
MLVMEFALYMAHFFAFCHQGTKAVMSEQSSVRSDQ